MSDEELLIGYRKGLLDSIEEVDDFLYRDGGCTKCCRGCFMALKILLDRKHRKTLKNGKGKDGE